MKRGPRFVCSAILATLAVVAGSARAEDDPQAAASKAPVTASVALPPAAIVPEVSPGRAPTREYLGVEALFGGSTRLGTPADGGAVTSSSGLALHGGLHYGWSRKWSLGLALDSAALGTSERRSSALAFATDTRRLTLLGLESRVHPLRWEGGRLFLGLFVGLGWETAKQIAAVDATSGAGTAFRSSTCSGRGDPSLALGLTGGFDYELGHDVSLLGRAMAATARLSDEPVEASERCLLPSGGSANMLSAQLGISVRFDLAGASAPAKGHE